MSAIAWITLVLAVITVLIFIGKAGNISILSLIGLFVFWGIYWAIGWGIYGIIYGVRWLIWTFPIVVILGVLGFVAYYKAIKPRRQGMGSTGK